MEILVPGLMTAVLLGVAVAFFVLPTFAPLVLVAGSAVVLAIALYIHYRQFGVMEYERATWMYSLRKYASYILIAITLLVAYGFYAINNGMGGASEFATPALPAVGMPPTSGGGFGAVGNTVASRLGELFRKGRISV